MRRLTVRERRLAALSILLAVLAIAWLAILRPIVGGFAERRDERAQLAATLARNERLIASAPAWRRLAQQQRVTADRFAIAAASSDAAAELLKQRLIKLFTDHGASVAAVQDEVRGRSNDTVAVRADAQLTLTQLYETLRDLQGGEPYVVIEYLSITANKAFDTGRAGPLDVRLEVSERYHAPNLR